MALQLYDANFPAPTKSPLPRNYFPLHAVSPLPTLTPPCYTQFCVRRRSGRERTVSDAHVRQTSRRYTDRVPQGPRRPQYLGGADLRRALGRAVASLRALALDAPRQDTRAHPVAV